MSGYFADASGTEMSDARGEDPFEAERQAETDRLRGIITDLFYGHRNSLTYMETMLNSLCNRDAERGSPSLADEFAYVEARSAVERELDRLGYNDSNTNVVLKLAEFLKSVKL